jgi:DNA-binding transcriptional MerR regulator
MDDGELLLRTRLDAQALETWIAAGWLVPRPRGQMREFSDIDVARASLILDLRRLGGNDEGIPVVLDLIDVWPRTLPRRDTRFPATILFAPSRTARIESGRIEMALEPSVET